MCAKALTRTKAVPHPHLRVAPTLYGRGVFTRRFIAKGETVGLITGDVFHEREYQSAYCMDLGYSLVLEPRNIFRCMNHSCDPNCEIVAYRAKKDYRIHVEAIRDIAAGEQLAIDYAWPAEFAIPCQCGSKKCRKWIVHREELGEIAC